VDKVYLSVSLGFFADDPVLTFQTLPMELVAFSLTKTIVACSLRIARKSATDRSAANSLYFSLFTFHLSAFPQPLRWLATIVKPLWGFHSFIFHFSLFTLHFSFVRRLAVGSPPSERRQTADKPVGKRRSDDPQTAD
jgi:hypothetical protein